MNRFKSITKPLMWPMTLLLVALTAGCGGAGTGGGDPATMSPTAPGVGTGLDGTGKGPAPVVLGKAGNFVILTKSGITNVPTSVITGDMGVSPIAAAAITGFSLAADSSNVFSNSAQVTGKVYAADYTSPTPANLTTAVSNMETAYTDAAGRAPDYTELGAGNIGGLTLPPATYKWSTGVSIPTDVTLNGGPNDVWIFETAGGITQASATKVILTGGALPKNVFWQAAGGVAIDTTAHMEGVILSQTAITLATGASANSRLLAQTAVTLQSNTVTQPNSAATADTTAPVVSSTVPSNAATGVAIGGNIAVTFSEAMDPATVTTSTFTLNQGATVVSGVVSYVGNTATFTPSSSLASSTIYTAAITTGVKDLAGNALADTKTWNFTTGVAADTTAPTVSSTIPANAATATAVNANVTATFSEAMDPVTVTTATFTLSQGATVVSGAVTSPSTTTATFNPTSDLVAGTIYTAAITTGVKDLAGNALALTKTWSFTTAAAVTTGQLPVDLGLAGNYAILAKSGISTVPASVVTGDIGVSPIDSTAITGFSLIMDSTGTFSTASQVIGKAYAADYTSPTPANLTTAVSNMEAAYTDAAGRTTPDFTELGAGDISGMTVVPGLYKWSTGVLISSDVTLNGGPNDVWIFQIAGGITQASATHVILTGGALPKNVFWQAASGVALDTTAHMEGVILSQTAISLATGATVNGRLLAQTAVTLDSDVVTQPAP